MTKPRKKKRKKETKERKRSLLHSLGRKCRNKQCRLHKNDTRLCIYTIYCNGICSVVILELDPGDERPALGFQWPAMHHYWCWVATVSLPPSLLPPLAATFGRFHLVPCLFVFKALFYTHGRLLLLESFSIERSGSCLQLSLWLLRACACTHGLCYVAASTRSPPRLLTVCISLSPILHTLLLVLRSTTTLPRQASFANQHIHCRLETQESDSRQNSLKARKV